LPRVRPRPSSAIRHCAASVPPGAGIPTEALVAQVLVARYADHLPLYRQAQMMARQGVALDRSTLAFRVGYAPPGGHGCRRRQTWPAAQVRCLDRFRRRLTSSIQTFSSYSDAPGRGQEHAKSLLGGYRGILQCDGYRADKSLTDPCGQRGPRVLAFCWSHVCRGFHDLAKGGTAPIASEALARIAALYRIEADIRGKTAVERLAARQARSRPLVTELRTWFEVQLAKLPARGPTAEAIHYALNHWDGLEQFLDDGRIEVDSHSVERAVRSVALSRKNALFAGSDEGGANWAAIASLIETCKLNAVEPQHYLADLLTRLVNGWPQACIDELMLCYRTRLCKNP
jgi:transposase